MDDNHIPEIIGTKDLRIVFEQLDRVRGTFFINNVEIASFDGDCVYAVVEQINRFASRTFVDASVDENYHLILEARSPAPILVRKGQPPAVLDDL